MCLGARASAEHAAAWAGGALTLYRSGVRTHPMNAKLHFNYGVALSQHPDFAKGNEGGGDLRRESLAHYERAVELWPRCVRSLLTSAFSFCYLPTTRFHHRTSHFSN